MPFMTFRQLFNQVPPVTRAYTTACSITFVLVVFNLVSPYQLYLNPTLIFRHYQFWRLVTTFLYSGTTFFGFVFHMLFTYRYCRMLEEGSFRGRTADFVLMMVFGGVCMIVCSFFCSLLFLAPAVTIMLVYVWARRNPLVRISFFGFLNFQAPYLPWVLLAFNIIVGHTFVIEIVGIIVGHLYYFLEDVFPARSGGIRILKTPRFLTQLFETDSEDRLYRPPPEHRPGGFPWNERLQQPDNAEEVR